MSLENRIFLNWDEAAQFLGMDREGLRQALLYEWSPRASESGKAWLPVMLTLPKGEFMTRLVFDSYIREPEFRWNSRDSYYRETEGKTELFFTDGSALPLRGGDGPDSWDSHHGSESGYGICFTVSGSTLVLSPECVSGACADDGYMASAAIAPKGWCKSGFPEDFHFEIIDVDNSLYAKRPKNLFDVAVFDRAEVASMKAALAKSRAAGLAVKADGGEKCKADRIRADREETLLRVVAGLWALSGLPTEQHTTADKLSALFDDWGWDKPVKGTIADRVLKIAANLPGAKVRK